MRTETILIIGLGLSILVNLLLALWLGVIFAAERIFRQAEDEGLMSRQLLTLFGKEEQR